MERVIIQLEREQLDGLDEMARAAGRSRASFIRGLVDVVLAEQRRRRSLDAVIASYTARPQTDDEVIWPYEGMEWPEWHEEG